VTASHGLRTLLLDRARFPRAKVCGEGCTPRAVQNLQRMGLIHELEPEGARVHQAFLVFPGGVELFADLPQDVAGGRILVIPRAILDERLVQRALRAGARLREGVHVTHVEAGEKRVRVHVDHGSPIDSDLVIGCDGIPSLVRRSVGARPLRPNQTAYAMRGIFEQASLTHERALTLLWDRSVLPAYGWLFPLPGGRANVGIGIRMDQLRRGGQSLRALFEGFLGLDRVRCCLDEARLTGRAMGHALPMTASPGPVVFDRAMLAGDAAGFVNPLTGEGIEFALESGDLAGRVAVMAAGLGTFDRRALMPYSWGCADQFGSFLRLNAWLRWVFAVPSLLDRLGSAANRSKALCDDVARIALAGEGARFTARMAWGALTG